MDIKELSRQFAINAHKGQTRKSEPSKPMVIHPINVANILEQYNFDDSVISAGYLHDVIEDTKYTKKDLEKTTLPTIVCLHFGVAEDNMKGNWWFESCPETALLGNRKELKQILKKHKNIIGVFSGHQHWTKHIVEEGLSYHILGSMTENINNDGIPDGVYFVVNFDGQNLAVEEQHIRL